MLVSIGTQSWLYPEWNGAFYNDGTQASAQLKAYAEEFSFVEVDATFYGTPPSTSIARWLAQTPSNFIFAPKLPREITHERSFRDCESQADIFFARMLELGSKLGPVLVQTPPGLDVSARDQLLRILARRPEAVRCVLEFRNRSWFTHGDGFHLCEQAGLTVATVDAPFLPLSYAKRTLERSTSGLAYLRLLGTRDESISFRDRIYDRMSELNAWAQEIQTLNPEHCYITTSNYFEGFAPETARLMYAALGIPHTQRHLIEQVSFF